MKKGSALLLVCDAAINLLLGLALLLYPVGLGDLLGLPPAGSYFYSSILGGVIFGIGIALVLEYLGLHTGGRGLGLEGAIAINLCGGGALLIWLLFGGLALPPKGLITLWIVALLVVGLGLVELFSRLRKIAPK
jgi:hypothetical protein